MTISARRRRNQGDVPLGMATLLATAGSLSAQVQGADDFVALCGLASPVPTKGKYAEANPMAIGTFRPFAALRKFV